MLFYAYLEPLGGRLIFFWVRARGRTIDCRVFRVNSFGIEVQTMGTIDSRLRGLLLATALIAVVVAGPVTWADAVSQAVPGDQSGPSPAETKAIAEEGFIYGLPIVMNYAVMYEYFIDRNSGQYKVTLQPDLQRASRVHLQGHDGDQAQQRHAIFRHCGWTCGRSRWWSLFPR